MTETARITYVGHATVLVEQAGMRILTDPLLRGRVAYVMRRVPVPSPAALKELDAILVSHAHADHLDPASLRRLRHSGPVVGPRGSARLLRWGGAKEVVELAPGERCAIGPLQVEAVPALHDGRRIPLTPRIDALGYLLDGPARVYFAGDTDLFDGMAELAGRVDVALLPVAGWGPRLPPGHLDPESAARAVELIRPRLAIPIHWGTLLSPLMRGGDLRAPAEAFAAAVAASGAATEVRVLAPGEAADLPVRWPA